MNQLICIAILIGSLIVLFVIGAIIYAYLQNNAPVIDDGGDYWPPVK